jgi:predicted peroxiredoxin
VDIKNLLYVVTRGSEEPMNMKSALMLAITAASTGNRANVFFHLEGVKVITAQGTLNEGLGQYPGTREAVEQARAVGVGLYASEESLMMYGLTSRDIIQGVKVVGSTKINELMSESDAVLSL